MANGSVGIMQAGIVDRLYHACIMLSKVLQTETAPERVEDTHEHLCMLVIECSK